MTHALLGHSVTTIWPRPPTVLIAAWLLAGCGGGDENSEVLLDRLPSDSRIAAAVDVAGAREALELPDDANLFTGGSTDEQRLVNAAAYALPHLQRPFDVPILEALDHKRVVAAASGLVDQLTVVRTTQPVEDVLNGLEDEGYEREGDLLVSDEPSTKVVYRAAAESDGLLLLASNDETLQQALNENEDEEEGVATRLVSEELEGPVRVMASNPDSDCLTAVGIQDSVEPGGGEFVLRPRGKPDSAGVRLGEDSEVGSSTLGETRFEETEGDGDFLRVPYAYDGAAVIPSPPSVIGGDLPSSFFYDCD